MNYQSKYSKKTRVAVALSGGIDSAFAAYILKSKGFDVFGAVIKTYDEDIFLQQVKSVGKIAKKLGIKYFSYDLKKYFDKTVIRPFCQKYIDGITPNPCVDCNKIIKFGILWKLVKDLGADYIASGHYARIIKPTGKDLFEIRKGFDKKKDQSYFLWQLDQDQLARIKLPLGDYTKEKVLYEARNIFPHLIPCYDSQEICFIAKNNYQEFLSKRLKEKNIIKKGPVINAEGKIIGEHKGYLFYTIGQRRGIGISHSIPLYVIKIIPGKNTIVVGEENELFSDKFYLKDINYISQRTPDNIFKTKIKIRYNSCEFHGEVKMIDKKHASVKAYKPQKAITPGQSAVFYSKDTLIGGGIIE